MGADKARPSGDKNIIHIGIPILISDLFSKDILVISPGRRTVSQPHHHQWNDQSHTNQQWLEDNLICQQTWEQVIDEPGGILLNWVMNKIYAIGLAAQYRKLFNESRCKFLKRQKAENKEAGIEMIDECFFGTYPLFSRGK